MAEWPILSTIERRVLGVMVEKAKTTPDVYPMSLNSLTTGCNQKSNREPVLNLEEEAVEETLIDLQKRGFTTRITGGRVERWRHNLYDLWTSNKLELAVLAELLLRGPQTEGELRGHASRMEPIADLPALRQVLQPLIEKKLVLWLGPEGRRGSLIAHAFLSSAELEAAKSRVGQEPAYEPAQPRPAAASAPPVPTVSANEVAALKAELESLRADFDKLRGEFTALKQSLGG